MPTLNLETSLSIVQGGETIAPDISRQISVGNTSFDSGNVNVPGAASAAAYTTLWVSTGNAPGTAGAATFTCGMLVVDPDGLQSNERWVDIQITVNSVTHVERISNKGFPKLFNLSNGAAANTISKIEFTNISGTVASTDDVIVRLRLWK